MGQPISRALKMGKSKAAGKGDVKAAPPSKENQVKDATLLGATCAKLSQKLLSQKKMNNHVAAKGDKVSKKAKKEPTPESSDSDEEASSASSASSDGESELETAKPVSKANGAKTNGAAKAAALVEEDSSDSSESSASSDGEAEATAPSSAPAIAVGAKQESSEGSEDSESEGDSDEDESDDETTVPGAVDSKELHGKLEKVASTQVQRYLDDQASVCFSNNSSGLFGRGIR